MQKRQYYSIRTGKNPNAGQLDLPAFIRFFISRYLDFKNKGYFQENFGIECIDGYIPGNLGDNVDLNVYWHIRKDNLWPIEEKQYFYTEEDIFDIIEFLYDFISKPLEGTYHSYGDCGYHYESFDKSSGQLEFRNAMNALLAEYGEGFELSDNGEILTLDIDGLNSIYEAPIPNYDIDNVKRRVEEAIHKFRRYRSSVTDRHDAVRMLADVLEYLRPKLKEALDSKDENDLFNIINNFGIRHHNPKQKTNYDPTIWCGWMFFFYLATIHAALRLLLKQEKNSAGKQ